MKNERNTMTLRTCLGKSSLVLVTYFVVVFALMDLIAQEVNAQEKVTKLELELQLLSPTFRLGQNPEYVVRLKNPNGEPVVIPHAPALDLLRIEIRTDKGFQPHRSGSDIWIDHEPALTIPALGIIESRALLHKLFSLERWPEKPGKYEIRMAGFPTRATIGPNAESVIIEWVRPSVKITAIPLDAHHEAALSFLKRETARMDNLPIGAPREFEFTVMCETFLAQYSPSDYDREIQYEMAVRSSEIVDNRTKLESLSPQDKERLLAMWSAGIIKCLNAGPPYNEEFLEWREAGGSHLLVPAAKHRQAALTEALCREFDKRMPEDREGRLFRGVLVEAMTGSMEKAESQAAAYKTEFPDGKYARSIDGFLRLLKQ